MKVPLVKKRCWRAGMEATIMAANIAQRGGFMNSHSPSANLTQKFLMPVRVPRRVGLAGERDQRGMIRFSGATWEVEVGLIGGKEVMSDSSRFVWIDEGREEADAAGERETEEGWEEGAVVMGVRAPEEGPISKAGSVDTPMVR